jgi:hypothetical protein
MALPLTEEYVKTCINNYVRIYFKDSIASKTGVKHTEGKLLEFKDNVLKLANEELIYYQDISSMGCYLIH